jgi:hypothetical protein
LRYFSCKEVEVKKNVIRNLCQIDTPGNQIWPN